MAYGMNDDCPYHELKGRERPGLGDTWNMADISWRTWTSTVMTCVALRRSYSSVWCVCICLNHESRSGAGSHTFLQWNIIRNKIPTITSPVSSFPGLLRVFDGRMRSTLRPQACHEIPISQGVHFLGMTDPFYIWAHFASIVSRLHFTGLNSVPMSPQVLNGSIPQIPQVKMWRFSAMGPLQLRMLGKPGERSMEKHSKATLCVWFMLFRPLSRDDHYRPEMRRHLLLRAENARHARARSMPRTRPFWGVFGEHMFGWMRPGCGKLVLVKNTSEPWAVKGSSLMLNLDAA